jgi:hypothetical protein
MRGSGTRAEAKVKRTVSTYRVRLSRWALSLIGGVILLGIIAIGPASASAALPTYEGALWFPPIHSASDPEEYSWEVRLGAEQTLELVDEQHAEAYYAPGHHPAFGITAEPAHDADGATVPTSLSVTQPDVITLTVHYRAGNPAAHGAPFEYPIIAGAGWEGGYVTERVTGPKDETELREERERIAREEREAAQRTSAPSAGQEEDHEDCLVPRLKGLSLKISKKRLRQADCRLGKLRKLKAAIANTGKVVDQDPRPGTVLAAGDKVSVKIGQ